MSLPLKKRRSPNRASGRRKRPLRVAGAIPAIFVQVKNWAGYGETRYVGAHIQVRRAKYRYLVWYENGKKHEFYLGSIKTVPLSRSPDQLAGSVARGSAARARTGV